MAVFGIAMVRDEADIVTTTVTHMLNQVDHVIVADNLSTDGTRDLLASLACPQLTIVDDDEPAYTQAEKMTRLAAAAADGGADWVVPFDADEVWCSPHGRLGTVLDRLDEHAVAVAALYDHVATSDDPPGADPVTAMRWRRRAPAALPKVACRTSPELHIEMGNHGCHYSNGRWRGREVRDQLVVRHFPYRSAEQMTRKAVRGAAALVAAGMPREVGQHWRDYADLEAAEPGAIARVFAAYFHSEQPWSDPSLVFDPAAGWLM